MFGLVYAYWVVQSMKINRGLPSLVTTCTSTNINRSWYVSLILSRTSTQWIEFKRIKQSTVFSNKFKPSISTLVTNQFDVSRAEQAIRRRHTAISSKQWSIELNTISQTEVIPIRTILVLLAHSHTLASFVVHWHIVSGRSRKGGFCSAEEWKLSSARSW